MSRSIRAHAWTIAPAVRHQIRGDAPDARDWSLAVPDDRHGVVHLTGLWSEAAATSTGPGAPGAPGTVLVVLHGLGGRATSHYCAAAARAARRAGVACLRLSQRGADRRGEDLHHAGLTADLHHVLRCPEVASAERVVFLGYSVGGHVALRLATEDGDERLTAVAAACPPLDLGAAADAFDRRVPWLYRQHVLVGLKRSYRALHERGRAPAPWDLVRRARTIRELDAVTVVPRHGFRDADDYYATTSVAGRLDALRVPALLLAARHDPIVPPDVLAPALARRPARLEVAWLERAGHVGWPAQGLPALGGTGAEPSVEDAVLAWLLRSRD